MGTLTELVTLGGIDEEVIPIVIFLVGGSVAVIAIVFNTVKRMIQTHQQEKTRREIAAYVAEGSITPQDGERLMAAGRMQEKD